MLPPALGAQTDERAYAPEAIRFDRIGLEQGLSQSTVSAIAQDTHGFMWFGTHDGLNRFDGYKITVFKHDPTDSNSLSHNTVWALMCDRK
ncbi:MAG TPA: two-component regulator propeller domain-containing protein, partial [Bacteroidota bacterium]|nr:two-component regulator propeller domain-containing protein [Bacteroidota bacterium]